MNTLLELLCLSAQFGVAKLLVFGLQFIDLNHIRTNALDLAVIFRADDLLDQIQHYRSVTPKLNLCSAATLKFTIATVPYNPLLNQIRHQPSVRCAPPTPLSHLESGCRS